MTKHNSGHFYEANMAVTKADEAIHKLDTTVALLSKDVQGMSKRIEDVEKIVKNGLSGKVAAIYLRMEEIAEYNAQRDKEKAEAKKLDDQQEHELKLFGMKTTAETRSILINGLVTGAIVLLGVLAK
jgi:predicted  nucleic acid-binding Zn-ribbon protein